MDVENDFLVLAVRLLLLADGDPGLVDRPREVVALHLDPLALELAPAQRPPLAAADALSAAVDVCKVLAEEVGREADRLGRDGRVRDVDPARRGDVHRRERLEVLDRVVLGRRQEPLDDLQALVVPADGWSGRSSRARQLPPAISQPGQLQKGRQTHSRFSSGHSVTSARADTA